MTYIFGHRGSAGTHPENTMISFQEAERAGADGIELDVQLTKDGEVIIIHDEKVDRTTDGKGYINNLLLKDIKKLNAGAKFQNGQFKAEIPTLNEFFEWFKGTNLFVNIEFKTKSIFNYELEEKTVAMVKKNKLEERVIFSSFNHYSLVYCYRLAPEIETAPLYAEGLFMPWIYAQSIRAKGIHPNYRVIPDELITLSQNHGIKVRPYTVNQDEDIKRFLNCNTHAIITDFPKKAKELKTV